MIKPEDVRFHVPADVGYDFAETNYFYVHVEEANVTAWVYTIARPGVGAMAVDVEAIDRLGRTSIDALYMDFQQHLPLVPRLESYRLPNGLSLETFDDPSGYRIGYVGVDDTELQWTLTGLMPPFDIHDRSMDPLASDDPNATGFGAAYSNHFDMTVRARGSLRLYGRTYEVDCVTTMDHSWGPRNERGLRPMGWINGNFGEDLAFQTIWSFDPRASGDAQFTLAHGYVLLDGEVRGLVRGRMRAFRGDVFPTGYETVLTDREGREYAFSGSAIAQHPWTPYSNSLAVFSTVRWHHGARSGVGLAQENWPLDRFTGRGPGRTR